MSGDFLYFFVISWVYLVIGMALGKNGCDHDYVMIIGASIIPISILFSNLLNKERAKK